MGRSIVGEVCLEKVAVASAPSDLKSGDTVSISKLLGELFMSSGGRLRGRLRFSTGFARLRFCWW